MKFEAFYQYHSLIVKRHFPETHLVCQVVTSIRVSLWICVITGLLGCITCRVYMLAAFSNIFDVAWSVCLSMCWSQLRAMQKWLNQSRCCVICRFLWYQVLDWGTYLPTESRNFGADVWILPHTAKQRSEQQLSLGFPQHSCWLAADVVGYHIKFFLPCLPVMWLVYRLLEAILFILVLLPLLVVLLLSPFPTSMNCMLKMPLDSCPLNRRLKKIFYYQ